MEILIFNIEWMLWNIFLAILGVFFGWLMVRFSSLKLKAIFGLLWLLFVPNAIYIVTDIIHIPSQLAQIDTLFVIPLLLQYAILEISGILTFVIAVYFFEITLQYKKLRLENSLVFPTILFTNFVIGFGVVVGRVQRTNSWEVFTNPGRVIEDAYNITLNPHLFIFTIVMGIIANIVYFGLKGHTKRLIKPYLPLKKNK